MKTETPTAVETLMYALQELQQRVADLELRETLLAAQRKSDMAEVRGYKTRWKRMVYPKGQS